MVKRVVLDVLILSLLISIIVGCGHPPTSVVEAPTAYYMEPHRPQFHFSPEKGWMNDPNGLVYYAGEYHLFYQYYPDSTVWGPMHWGHAISTDLIHWQHMPIALYPDSLGYIFSGSAVVDINNTSGFGTGDEAPLVAIFTHHDMAGEKAGKTDIETQSIAYSLDKGRTWTKYAGNPVVKNPGIRNFRDPKVFWHEASAHWIMPIAAGDHLDFYRSTNLREWEKSGEFGQHDGAHGGTWECPDIFPLTTQDGDEKWILIQNMDRGAVNGGSGTQYFIGQFDGNTFINDNTPSTILWFDYGSDNYAGVTWFGVPDGRRLFIGWMSQWFDYAQVVPTGVWRSAMTTPRELSLRQTADGLRLYQYPVEELDLLRIDTVLIPAQNLSLASTLSDTGSLLDISLTVDLSASAAEQFGLILKNLVNEKVVIAYNVSDSLFIVDRTNAGTSDFSDRFARTESVHYVADKTMQIRVVADVASVEVFVDEGRLAITEIFFPKQDYNFAQMFALGGDVHIIGGALHHLKSIWSDNSRSK